MAVPFGKREASEERTTVALTAPRPNGTGRREEAIGPARRWLRRIFANASPARRVRVSVKRAVEEGRLLPAWLLMAPPSALLGHAFSVPAASGAYQRGYAGPARRVRITSEGVESQTSDSISSTRNVARGISTSVQSSVGRPKNVRQRTVTATSMMATPSTRSAESPTSGARLTSHGATTNATTAAAAAAAPSKDREARNIRKRKNVVAKKHLRRPVQSDDDIKHHGLVAGQAGVPHSPAPLQPHLSATVPFIRERSDREATGSVADHGQVAGGCMMPPSPKIPKTRSFFVEGVVYTTCRVLGRGGSAKVYEVVAPDGQHFALKRSVHRDPDIRHRMWGEVIKLAGLDSPHIIRLIGAQLTDEAILVVLELGELNLETWLSQLSERLDVAQIEHLWKQILRAVLAVHKAGYIHGDLKPSNIVFVGAVLKLIDFDIAAEILSGNSHVVRESGLGTYDYISPEALEAQKGESVVKARRSTDVWSLGCVLYQMVLGEPPFAKFIGIKKLYEIANPDGIRVPVIANPAIQNVLERCLQYDQANRPTVEDLLKISFVLFD
jgi:hypothetical protein